MVAADIALLMARVEALEAYADSLRERCPFSLHEVNDLEELAELIVPPPAIAYVREDGNYYFMFPWSSDLADTPYHSVVGVGWHNLDSPTPRYDRPIHIIHTQWLNGWNLDYYPNFIDTSQGGQTQEYLEDVFAKHHGPPSKDSGVYNPPQVIVMAALSAGETTLYLEGLEHEVNTLCVVVVKGISYAIVDWDGNNTPPTWVSISPELPSDIVEGEFVIVQWPEIELEYQGTLTSIAAEGASSISITGLTGPIDTSYRLILDGVDYKITDYSPQSLPTTLTIEPSIAEELPAETPWSMIKGQGQYNTIIENLVPGDFIFRAQIWQGTVDGAHSEGDTEINISGVSTEIATGWASSRNIPHSESDWRARAQFGSIITIDGLVYEIIDHEPNGRVAGGIDEWVDTAWKPCGLPTTKIFLKTPLLAAVEGDTEFVIKNKHWYVVSVEHLGSDPRTTSWSQSRFCEGHNRDCFDFYHIATGEAPSRFELMLHVVATEDVFDTLYKAGKIIPGDLVYHQAWKNWYQVLPRYEDGVLDESEVSFGDFARSITVRDEDEFLSLARHFELNNLWVINNTRDSQVWQRPLVTGINSDGSPRTSAGTWSNYHPAEFIYRQGRAESA